MSRTSIKYFQWSRAEKSAIITSMYDNLQDIYVFFSASSKPNKDYQEEVLEVDKNSLKLRNMSKTIWVYSSESIEAVWGGLWDFTGCGFDKFRIRVFGFF